MRIWTVLLTLAFCAPLFAAPESPEASGQSARFALRATLEAAQPVIEGSRFRLSGQLTRQQAPMPAQQAYGFGIQGHFAPEGSCTPDQIFGHGFELAS